jgi:LysR family transcriptional regulator, flagellar master operon regulator
VLWHMSADIDAARTFLEVAASGSFVGAAEALHITQTAVSARIRVLESQLGRKLFDRSKSGARLTTAGQRFVKHATTLVQVWERARQQVQLPAEHVSGVSVGAELSLWDPLLVDWLLWMREAHSDVALRVEVNPSAQMLAAIKAGSLDACIVHEPPHSSDLACELILDEKLVLVASSKHEALSQKGYVYVDWGTSFASNHDAALSPAARPTVSINFGPLARTYVLSHGGSGYFRFGSVRHYLQSGELHEIPGAPVFSHSVYLVYSARRDCSEIELIRTGFMSCIGVGPGTVKRG